MSCSSCGRPLDEECKCSTDIAIEEADPGHTLPYFSEQGPDYSATKSRKHAMLALNVGSVSQGKTCKCNHSTPTYVAF